MLLQLFRKLMGNVLLELQVLALRHSVCRFIMTLADLFVSPLASLIGVVLRGSRLSRYEGAALALAETSRVA